jgi:biotin carboxylase
VKMLTKLVYIQLIVWAPTREKAIVRMQRALNDTIITGKANDPLQFAILMDD